MAVRPTDEQILISVTSAEKELLLKNARKCGISVNTYVIRALEEYHKNIDTTDVIDEIIDQMNQATNKAISAIDNALSIADESNNRNSEMEPKTPGREPKN
ncbi:MAG: hypothetical protein AB2809_13725 [Candidatus Thiodiazotropha sp.]